MKLSKNRNVKLVLLLLLIVAILPLLNSYLAPETMSIVAGDKIFDSDNPSINEAKYDNDIFTVSTEFTNLTPTTILQIVPDNCLKSVRLNGKEISLTTYKSEWLCDWREGVKIALSAGLKFGSNKLELTIVNKDGPWGVSIKHFTKKSTWWLSIILLLSCFILLALPYVPGIASFVDGNFSFSLIAVVLFSFFTFFHKYWEPRGLYWDENYHVASAEKYLQGTFFMEPHPPLGKMLIAAGEKIFDLNERSPEYISSNRISSMSEGASFAGYRFFPALMAWLSAIIFFLILRLMLKSNFLALSLSSLFIFDNALIVHLRGAMLEGPLLFFMLLFGYLLLKFSTAPIKNLLYYAIAIGFMLGAAIATKLTALFLIILVPPALLAITKYSKNTAKAATAGLFIALTATLTYSSVWMLHYNIASKVNDKLDNDGYYKIDEEFKKHVGGSTAGNISTMPLAIKNSHNFFMDYQKGVPNLNLCKIGENGSPWFFWPIGGRSISYRWEHKSQDQFRYLYLIANPFCWAVGFCGLLLFFSRFFLASFYSGVKFSATSSDFLSLALFIAYIGYMVAISSAQSERVLYLYHYFPALIISYLLFSLEILKVKKLFFIKINKVQRQKLLFATLVSAMAFFLIYRPFSHFRPIDSQGFDRRNIVSIWDMKCAHCDFENPYYKSTHYRNF